MRWDLVAKCDRMRRDKAEKEKLAVPADNAFWRAWKANPWRMHSLGYRVRKDENGRYHVWIERLVA
jgi:hypothetical protein